MLAQQVECDLAQNASSIAEPVDRAARLLRHAPDQLDGKGLGDDAACMGMALKRSQKTSLPIEDHSGPSTRRLFATSALTKTLLPRSSLWREHSQRHVIEAVRNGVGP